MLRVMVVDDEVNMAQAIRINLEAEGYAVETFNSAEKALIRFREEPPDLVLTDLKMPRMDGLAFMQEIRRRDELVPVVMMTAYATVQTAVEAMKAGAYDYVMKPFEPTELKMVLAKAAEVVRLRRENMELRGSEEEYVGSSRRTKELLDLVDQVAETRATVLIRGESGTGKEVVAQRIHSLSERKDGPFIKMNCAAIPENLLESELFGHVKGAFTGAVQDKAGKFHLADGGTIFLDEVGDLTLPLQAKFLRVLQERQFEKVGGTRTIQVDVRIIAATHRDLEQAIAAGEFREDLFYRLNVFPVNILPLRERPEDIADLVKHFAARFGQELGRPVKGIEAEFLAGLLNYNWPGNARELANFIERSMILARNGVLGVELLAGLPGVRPETGDGSSADSLGDRERDHIREVLARTGGNKAKAAEILGIDRSTLYRMMKRYNL